VTLTGPLTEPVTEPAAEPGRRRIAPAAEAVLAPRPPWIPATPGVLELGVGVGVGVAAALASPVLAGPLGRILAPLATDSAGTTIDPADSGDPGWFGPDSVAWQVHADGSLLIGGIAAFTLQALHPLAMAGVAEHSAFSEDFLGRTRRTGEFVQGVVYGSSAEAQRLCDLVNRIHRRVVGVSPDGRPYAASDPDLLDWVHATEYASIVAANRRFALRPLRRDEMDTYIGEVAQVGRATGVLDPPTDWAGINASIERHRRSLAVAEYAALGVAFLDRPPIIPAAGQPVWRALWHGAIACLPPVARDLLRLPMPSRRDLAGTRAVLRVLGGPGGEPPSRTRARRRLGLA
jgi:uncharacterized protein (DUF2236 family)